MFDVEKFCNNITTFMRKNVDKVVFDKDGVANISQCLKTDKATINWIAQIIVMNRNFECKPIFIESDDVIIIKD